MIPCGPCMSRLLFNQKRDLQEIDVCSLWTDRANKEAIRDGLSRRRLGINKFTDGKISELQANKMHQGIPVPYSWAGVR